MNIFSITIRIDHEARLEFDALENNYRLIPDDGPICTLTDRHPLFEAVKLAVAGERPLYGRIAFYPARKRRRLLRKLLAEKDTDTNSGKLFLRALPIHAEGKNIQLLRTLPDGKHLPITLRNIQGKQEKKLYQLAYTNGRLLELLKNRKYVTNIIRQVLRDNCLSFILSGENFSPEIQFSHMTEQHYPALNIVAQDGESLLTEALPGENCRYRLIDDIFVCSEQDNALHNCVLLRSVTLFPSGKGQCSPEALRAAVNWLRSRQEVLS